MNSSHATMEPFGHLLELEERIRLSGAALPKMEDPRPQWTGVKCRSAGYTLILRLLEIAEILKDRNMTSVPRCAPWMRGVVNLRGRLLPVFRPEYYFDAPVEVAGPAPIVVIDSDGLFCGIEVDEVWGMQKYYEEDLREISDVNEESLGFLSPYIEATLSADETIYHQLNLKAMGGFLLAQDPIKLTTVGKNHE